LAAAREHWELSGTQIKAFKLPVWMFQKLKNEPGFRPSTTAIMGKYLGFTIIESHNDVAKMYEEHSADEYLVFGEE